MAVPSHGDGMPDTWLTSDTHLGHEKVARIRGFATCDEHDRFIARAWDRRVSPDDTVWVLGDIALNGWRDRLSWFATRPGVKHLVLGNHDRAHPLNRNAQAHLRTYLEVFESVQLAARVRHQGRSLLLSHFPYDGEGETRTGSTDRATQWRLPDEGELLLHGHVHDGVRQRPSNAGTPMIHVGLDAWGLAPVRLHEALAGLR